MAEAVGSILGPELDAQILMKLDDLKRAGAAHGFQLCLGYRDRCLGLYYLGDFGPDRPPVTTQTWFDLASLTKIISIFSLVCLALQSRSLQSVEQRVGEFLPFLKSDLKDRSLRDLLEHQSGLPATFEDIREQPVEREARVRYFLSQVDEMPRTAYGETLYSDVGYMILGLILERLHQQRLRDLFDAQVGQIFSIRYAPIDLPWSFLHRFFESDFVGPCQSLDNSSEFLSGSPQDPKAHWLGGDAGHAGLFAKARAVENWAKEIFLAYHGKGLLFSDRVLREHIDFNKSQRFLLGWDRPTQPSQAGELAGPFCLGHLGYTGSSLWVDFEKSYRVTLLCHRHFPELDPSALGRLRPQFHDWLTETVFNRLREIL
ncbi:MAG: class A beta-lactamase-related serine hydrolase [Bradymonadales bacterium]|nr:MAG: class A beta-lactamase-related serine hydrolase [Bradymonadales bacterium]